MIDLETARKQVTEYLREAEEGMNAFGSALPGYQDRPKLQLVIAGEEENAFGWIFSYTSKQYLDTRDVSYAIAGNAPVLVERQSGRMLVLGTAHPVEHYIESYKKYGDPHFQPGSQLQLVSCPADVDRIAVAQLVRDYSSTGLAAAKEQVDSCLAGHKPCLTASDPGTAEELAQKLESFHFTVRRVSRTGEPAAPPNGGLAEPYGSSGVGGGPPSVS